MLAVLPLLTAALSPLAAAAPAGPYPDKPIRVVVPNVSGSTADVVARLVAPGLGRQLGHPFIVDNRAGANGLIGTEVAAKATPDGYTLLVGTTGTLAVARHVARDVPYDTLKDFTSIGLLSVRAYVLVTHPELPVHSVRDLVLLARTQPLRTPYASAGSGSSTHLVMKYFERMAGIDLRHVPYKGSAQATLAVVGGRIPAAMLSIRSALPYLPEQRLRALATTSGRRVARLPDVPTLAESGLPGFEALTWHAMVAPSRTPGPVIARLSQALQQVVRSREFEAELGRLGLQPGNGDTRVLQALIMRDLEFYGRLTRDSGVKMN
jgi:tripartite-type tricarboxylate transporter receptor subunit TctC